MSWKKVKLDELLIQIKIPLNIDNTKKYNLVTVSSKGTIKLRSVVSGIEISTDKAYLAQAGCFIYSRLSIHNGAFGIIPKELDGALITSEMPIFKCDDKILIEFLIFSLQTEKFKFQLEQLTKGMGRTRVKESAFLNLYIDLPSISEQHLIVNSINLSQEKLNKLTKELSYQLTQTENLNQAILQEAVKGKLVPQNKKDEPASELLKQIKAEKAKSNKKEKPLPPIKPEEIPFDIPDNWVWCRLGEITDYGNSPKAEPSDLKNDTWVLDLEDIEKTTSNLLCKIRFNERNSLSTKSVFKVGDVLYSKLRPYLDKVIVADEDGVCTTEILPLKCYADLNPFYFKYALKRTDFLKYVNSVTKGMKMPRLGRKEGEIALFPLPPLPEQKRIVSEIEKQLSKTKQLKEHILANQQATEQLLKALLHQAFEVEERKVGKKNFL